MSILTAFNASPSSIAVKSTCCDSGVLDDSVKLLSSLNLAITALSRDESEIRVDTARGDEYRSRTREPLMQAFFKHTWNLRSTA